MNRKILPLQGRWLANGQTEGCHPIETATPLRHRLALTPPLQGGDVAKYPWRKI